MIVWDRVDILEKKRKPKVGGETALYHYILVCGDAMHMVG